MSPFIAELPFDCLFNDFSILSQEMQFHESYTEYK